jgi:hypothetical protein
MVFVIAAEFRVPCSSTVLHGHHDRGNCGLNKHWSHVATLRHAGRRAIDVHNVQDKAPLWKIRSSRVGSRVGTQPKEYGDESKEQDQGWRSSGHWKLRTTRTRHISVSTVKTHLASFMMKLNARIAP